MKIGKMAWRIGEIVDLFGQIAWIRDNGFEEVCFHTSPGEEGVWQGFCPFDRSESEVERLREAVSPFQAVDIHGPFVPFDTFLAARNPRVLEACLAEIEASITLAGRIGAETVTVHADVTSSMNGRPAARRMILDSLTRLGRHAAGSDVRIAAELTADYGIVRETGLPNVGLTIDLGHLSVGGGAPYRDYGSIGGLIRAFPERIFMVHAHDYDGHHDHLEIGTGQIDFREVCAALRDIGYAGSLCLEISPDRNRPEGMLRSRDRLRAILDALRTP